MSATWKELISATDIGASRARLRLVVNGRVQGVGFRPSIYRFATENNLAGYVQNTRLGVVIEIEGQAEAIHEFGESLLSRSPPLARIDSVDVSVVPEQQDAEFVIAPSAEAGTPETVFPVDTAQCDDCRREMLDPADRRNRYPFINCTNCGPRFTIITGLPYDRPMTTMKAFEMCEFCLSQYTDPTDRRFHAEPISCPDCGPHLTLIDEDFNELRGDPIDTACKLLAEGKVLAVKGLGGYHLACLADDSVVVDKLRTRKGRPAKPFALMFRSMEVIEEHCLVDETERRLLCSPESPIVLLRRKERKLPETVAPRNGYIGAFLPYTPIHHLLLEDFEVLIMTSANFTDEPLISAEDELETLLGRIADAAIIHDRSIAHKCDDSIFFAPAGHAVPLRRARGFVPDPVRLPFETDRCVLALGGHEKGTFAISRGDKAFISPHLGDLGDIRSQTNYREELGQFLEILGLEADAVVHDLHPDYFTTRLAEELGCPLSIAVQHHHAHAVSVMAEYALEEPVIAVSFDGTGYGSDGKLWGGEFLLASYAGFERLAHLAYVPLPGGEAAVREPWRMALVHLYNHVGDDAPAIETGGRPLFGHLPAGRVLALASRSINAPLTSSMGRLFDAVAFILGCGEKISYEAQAAIALEALALEGGDAEAAYKFDLRGEVTIEIDPAPVIAGILQDLEDGVEQAHIAAAFHHSVAQMTAELCTLLSRRYNCKSVVISGGVFQNRLLCESLLRRAPNIPARIYMHEIVPPNDGGVSLGQLQAGAAMIRKNMT
jgi:hydrogenase maturation protein HypF